MALHASTLFGPNSDLPPLPPIRDPVIRMQVFTHRSFAARPTHVFEDSPSDPSPDNEILEHLGDQVLGLVVTELLHEMYPYLRVGPSTKTRAMVVSNQTLANVSSEYRLHEHLRLHLAQSITLKASSNVQADVFEAYVGGLYRDQGLPAVQAWLRPLFRPYIDGAYRNIRDQHRLPPRDESGYTGPLSPAAALISPGPNPNAGSGGMGGGAGGENGRPFGTQSLSPPPSPPLPQVGDPPVGHLGLFNQRLQQRGMGIEWTFRDSKDEGTKVTPMWIAEAMVDGEVWGRGRGNTKKAAKNEAAKEGLVRLGWTDDSNPSPNFVQTNNKTMHSRAPSAASATTAPPTFPTYHFAAAAPLPFVPSHRHAHSLPPLAPMPVSMSAGWRA